MASIKLKPSVKERKRLRKKMPRGFSKQLIDKHNVTNTTVSKWFSGHFNSEAIYSTVLELAKTK